ncbi:MAG: phytoene/squalene synthase family protein [Deltaproteobacteria bacterium]|nr:phytoene/squalene synthase family protein [Deltaproteobacteria bacterium]
MNDLEFCRYFLSKVSRTFALNIGVLRGDLYRSILVAYLLCRIVDTIEDDPLLEAHFKSQKLCEYASLFSLPGSVREAVEKFLADIPLSNDSDEIDLLKNSNRVFNELFRLPQRHRAIISKHVQEMARGMADFQRKGSEQQGNAFLNDQDELERYCYYVAGTVGLMITSLASDGPPPFSESLQSQLIKRSVAFGLGLQLTNIAKDFYGDRERGWCYVPISFFTEAGIDPRINGYIGNEAAFVAVYRRLIGLAVSYLDEALLYSLDIPRRFIRFRLFCLWPLFMAAASLAKVANNRNLFLGHTVKIGRGKVRRILLITSAAVFSNSLLSILYRRLRATIAI